MRALGNKALPLNYQKTILPIESETANNYTIFMRIISLLAYTLFFYALLAKSLTAMNLDALIAQELNKKFFAIATADGDELRELKRLFDGDAGFYVGPNRETARKIAIDLPKFLCLQKIDQSPTTVYSSLVSVLATHNKLPGIIYSLKRLKKTPERKVTILINGALLAAARQDGIDTLSAMGLLIELGACPLYLHPGTELTILDAAVLSHSLTKVRTLVTYHHVTPTEDARKLARENKLTAVVKFFDSIS